jgi:hypothetical protein
MDAQIYHPEVQRQSLLASLPTVAACTLPDYIPAEVSFEQLGYFTPSSKRIKSRTTKEKIVAMHRHPDGTGTLLKVQILGTGKYGLPITSDLDYYRAFLKVLEKLTDATDEIPQPVPLPTKRLLRYAGKQSTARTFQEVKDWIRRCHFTGIQGCYFDAATGDYIEIGQEPLFPKYCLRGQLLDNGTRAETNYVWLASWFRTNYLQHHLRPVDLAMHRRLRKPIAKALYPLLESGWYATGGQPYTKSYRDLCQEFLLTSYAQLSRIKEQFDPAHQELARERFLAQWDYRSAATGHGWLIVYAPGAKYVEDQRAREARRQRIVHRRRLGPSPASSARAPLVPAADLAAAATGLVHDFYRRFHGVAGETPPARALAQAATLIAQHGEAVARFVVAYACQAAQASKYQPAHFGGILGYVPRALQAYTQRQARTAQQDAATREAKLREHYEAYVTQELVRCKAALPPEALAALEATVRAQVAADRTMPRFARAMQVRLQLDAVLATQAGLPSFAAWQQAREEA